MSRLSAFLSLDRDGLPPIVDLALVREQARTIDVRVGGIPAGSTLASLTLTAKASASDPDSAILLQKIVTTMSSLTTLGQITSASAPTALATITITASDLPDTFADVLAYQVWAVVTDAGMVNRQAPCLRGSIRTTKPLPLTLP
ncbi:MAG: hypothetical protein HOQ12_01805 [Gemmatimonadaceae bacterium]|nr:hypothetical protein [Gemmatimonadaceae bacterium]NUQ94990.1 hypothetical protein [Gemmatimonadaceae bacterium]NUR18247.1 hypothetical protein [Gemmatimonadaceae bacterium]